MARKSASVVAFVFLTLSACARMHGRGDVVVDPVTDAGAPDANSSSSDAGVEDAATPLDAPVAISEFRFVADSALVVARAETLLLLSGDGTTRELANFEGDIVEMRVEGEWILVLSRGRDEGTVIVYEISLLDSSGTHHWSTRTRTEEEELREFELLLNRQGHAGFNTSFTDASGRSRRAAYVIERDGTSHEFLNRTASDPLSSGHFFIVQPFGERQWWDSLRGFTPLADLTGNNSHNFLVAADRVVQLASNEVGELVVVAQHGDAVTRISLGNAHSECFTNELVPASSARRGGREYVASESPWVFIPCLEGQPAVNVVTGEVRVLDTPEPPDFREADNALGAIDAVGDDGKVYVSYQHLTQPFVTLTAFDAAGSGRTVVGLATGVREGERLRYPTLSIGTRGGIELVSSRGVPSVGTPDADHAMGRGDRIWVTRDGDATSNREFILPRAPDAIRMGGNFQDTAATQISPDGSYVVHWRQRDTGELSLHLLDVQNFASVELAGFDASQIHLGPLSTAWVAVP